MNSGEFLENTSFVSRKKRSFSGRLSAGMAFEQRVETLFKQLDVPIFQYGLRMQDSKATELLIMRNDATSSLLRFQPDFYIVSENTHFVECKSSMSDTPNFSYNYACYQAGLKLSGIGIRIIAVFGNSAGGKIHAEWVDQLKPLRVCAGSRKGSGKSFILVAKASLPSLNFFLERERIIDGRVKYFSG